MESYIYVKMIESGRISLYDYVMHFYAHLIKKNEMVNYKVSFVALIIVFYHYQMNKLNTKTS